jgi:hypothetical protein
LFGLYRPLRYEIKTLCITPIRRYTPLKSATIIFAVPTSLHILTSCLAHMTSSNSDKTLLLIHPVALLAVFSSSQNVTLGSESNSHAIYRNDATRNEEVSMDSRRVVEHRTIKRFIAKNEVIHMSELSKTLAMRREKNLLQVLISSVAQLTAAHSH